MTAMRRANQAHDAPVTVGFFLVPGFPLMSYAAAIEPLRAANQLQGRPLYKWWHASPGDAPVSASNGVAILPSVSIAGDALRADRLFVVAGGNPSTFRDRGVFAWLRRLARRGVAVGGISGGPYALARAGLLDGHRCTLHWEHIPAFKESFPNALVARSLFEVDGKRITCSGGVAALDLMLHLIGEDYGTGLAADVSDWFLHDHIRQGPSPQRMSFSLRFGVRDNRLLRVLEAINLNLETPLSRKQLADLACVSVRQLERLMTRFLQTTLHRYYVGQRVKQAHRLESETTMSMTEIANATGFASAAELRRVQKRLSDPPHQSTSARSETRVT